MLLRVTSVFVLTLWEWVAKGWSGLFLWRAGAVTGARPTMRRTWEKSEAFFFILMSWPHLSIHPGPTIHHDPEGHGAHRVSNV